MVVAHALSALLVIALEIDLCSYEARTRSSSILQAGSQLPRTRFGWLKAHYNDTINKRKNMILNAVQSFNRNRGLPLDTQVFKNGNDYAKCLAPIEVLDGEVFYRGASDPVWKSRLQR